MFATAVARHAATGGDCVALRTSTGTDITFAALDRRIRARAADFAARGLGAGDRCALLLNDPVDLLVGLLACDWLGATPVVLDGHWPAEVRAAALASVQPRLLVDTVVTPAKRPATPPSEGSRSELAAFTSGTTTAPRAVLRTAESWRHSFPAFSHITGIGPDSVVLVPGPLSATLFLFGALHALDCGATVLLAPADSELPWMVGHFVPAMLGEVTTVPYDLAGRTAIAAGAALPDQVAEPARRRGLDVVGYYGAAELSFVAIGRGRLEPFPGVDIQVRPPTGEIWVRSPFLAEGYLGGGPGPLRRDEHGFVTVGDLGRWSAGSLVVRGRGDRLLLTGGASVLVDEVESVLTEVTGSDVAVVGTPHPRLGQVVVAVIEEGGRPVPPLRDLRRAAASRLASSHRPRRWYVTARLPRTRSGKVARGAVAAGVADGSLPVVRLA